MSIVPPSSGGITLKNDRYLLSHFLDFFGFGDFQCVAAGFPYFAQGVVMSADEGDGFHADRDFFPVGYIGLDAD